MSSYRHRGREPQVDSTAWIAPTAVLCGDVRVGPQARVLWNAVVSGEDGTVTIGARCVVMEGALVRGRGDHPARVADDVLVGPHAHVNGAAVEEGAFIATGAALFPGAHVGRRAEVRINAVVQVNSTVAEEVVVPIGWVAVGDPAELFPPDRHEEIWAIQQKLDFPGTVYGLPRSASARERMTLQVAWYGEHRNDEEL